MSRRGNSPQKRQDALIQLAIARAMQTIQALQNVVTSVFPVAPVLNGSSSVAGGVNIAAIDYTPRQEGFVLISFVGFFAIAAADTIAISVNEISSLTSITGGATAGTPAGKFHFATAGSPLVITAAGATSLLMQTQEQIAAGNIAEVPFALSFVSLVASRAAFALNFKTTGGQVITPISLSGSANEV